MSGLSEAFSLLSYNTGMEMKKISSKNNWKHEYVADNGVFLVLSVRRWVLLFKVATIQSFSSAQMF